MLASGYLTSLGSWLLIIPNQSLEGYRDARYGEKEGGVAPENTGTTPLEIVGWRGYSLFTW